MKLLFELPKQVYKDIKDYLGDDEFEPIFCIPADLNKDNQYVDGWLVIANNKVLVHQDNTITKDLLLDKVDKFEVENLVGSGCFIANNDNNESENTETICFFTKEQLPRYKFIEKALREIKEQGHTYVKSTEDENICPKCGRKLPGDTKICTACMDRFSIFKKIWGIAKKQTKIYVIALFLFLITNILTLIPPKLNRILIDDYLKIQNKNLRGILVIIVSIGLMKLISNVTLVYRRRIMIKASSKLSLDLRNMVYEKLQSFSLKYIHKYKTGDLMNRVTGDTRRIRDFIHDMGAEMFNEIILLIGITIILFMKSWKVALLVYIPVPVIAFAFINVNKKIRGIYRKQGRQWDKANSVLQEMLSGIRVIKAFGLEDKAITKFNGESKKFAQISIKNEKLWNTVFPLGYFIMTLGNFFVILFGGNLILQRQLTIGELVELIQYASMLYGPLNWMIFFPRKLADAMVAIERVFGILEEEPDIQDTENPIDHHNIKGDIKFENVTFGYETHEPVLQNINIHIKPGEMIGLVGHSGAGKSTFINLLMRLYDVDEGKILIDGIDIRDLSQEELRRQIGVVLQETFLFSGTVFDNIRYTKPDATVKEVIRAAKIANAHDFIMNMPDAYDTHVGENGQRLSGGEKQRIAIARAILCDPKILILDEATSSLDTGTEQQIQDAMSRVIKNRTTIAIAHRLSTLRNSDRLLVLNEGKKAELGSHVELMDEKGIYCKLVNAQLEMNKVKGVAG